MAFLVVEEKGVTSHIALTAKETSIGRAPDNNVMIKDEKASRHHCVIVREDDGFSLRDLNSRNGTFVNDQPVLEQELSFGETFRIGSACLAIYNEESSAFETQNAIDAIRQDTLPAEGPVKIGINEAFSVFQEACAEDTPAKFYQACVRFVGRLIPGVRVCLSIADDSGSAVPRAYFNFISGTPKDELPANFQSVADRMLSPKAKLQTRSATKNLPACAFVPLKCGKRLNGVLYVERENKEHTISEQQATLLDNASHVITAVAGGALAVEEYTKAEQNASRLKREMGQIREELEARLDMQTAELTALRIDAESGDSTAEFRHDYSAIIGRSEIMRDVFRLMDKVTDMPMPVLILGEPGSGKELIARALHFNSARAQKGRFVAENCAALPDTLFESELFGYRKGAFTGADRDKEGLFGLANGGTIFLDEIGEISMALQAKLLRVIEEGVVRPIGAKETNKVDFRLVCATNKDLSDQVKKGEFRQDLFFRINVVVIRLPALRERREDIPLMVDHFLKIEKANTDQPNLKLDRGVLKALTSYHWPGNVRELENEIKRMVALSDGEKIDASLLSPRLKDAAEDESIIDMGGSLKDVVEGVEKRKIIEALHHTRGNKTRAAETLGLSRLGLRKKMERYGIDA